MSFFSRLISTLFGGKKSDKDIKVILPRIAEINREYQNIRSLSDDELRNKTFVLKQKIADYIREDEIEIISLKSQIEGLDNNIEEAESLYAEIDKIQKTIDNKIENALNSALPVAFAIIKETARRFVQNPYLEVTALEWDKDLAAKQRSYIEIVGEKARWKKQWLAGGNMISWDMIHYDVQLIGGVVLHEGKIAEMATGEGKTLVATLPVFLNALSGKGVHIVTVNDYLAKRDSEWMGVLYEFHGLTVDCIDRHEPNSEARRKAYLADITFGTNNEFGFDYLRDNMAFTTEDLVQRGHNYAIVDEVDSVLIDDARTPLIISGPIPKGEDQLFDELKPKVVKLFENQKRLVTQLLTDAKKFAQENKPEEAGKLLLRCHKGMPKYKPLIKILSEQGMKALMFKTENIYIADNAKRMPEITEELFFVIDEKNHSVELTDKGIDLITGQSDDPKFFVLPDIGGEVAEIEKLANPPEERLLLKEKILTDYAIKSERVHTIHQLLKAYSLFEKDVEYVVLENKVKIVDEQTGRILEGRRYSDGLHQAIEAKENVKVEAATQTFATITLQNYFRMYKKLAGMTGTAETEAGEFWDIYKLDVTVIPTNVPVIRKDFDDLVYKTKREKYNAAIDEIVRLNEKGRPVLVGTTSVEVSELLSRMLKLRNIKHNVLNAKYHQKEAEIVAEAGKSKVVTIATNMAGRGTDIKLSSEVKAAGGLAIIGTERHEARRVDRQLRGRAGRQGDPGTSQFFLSLEDDLMRMFGSDRIAKIMDRLGLKDGEVIQHSMISRSIGRAQRRVEENNFGIRKRLLEYDDVMNSQREVIYKQRKHALYGEKIEIDIANTIYDVCSSVIFDSHGKIPFKEFELELIRNFVIKSPFTEKEFLQKDKEELVEILYAEVQKKFKTNCDKLSTIAYPIVLNTYQEMGNQYELISFPITDGIKMFNLIVPLKKAVDNRGKELVKILQKTLLLIIIDEAWKEHLREMDDLKQSVQNAAYEQKDPLLIYKLESYELFRAMIDKNNRAITSFLMKAMIPLAEDDEVKQAKEQKRNDMNKYKANKPEFENRSSTSETPVNNDTREKQKIETYVRETKKINPNDPCPCGSGKKYKKCHGVNE